jgi:hypothetical protein
MGSRLKGQVKKGKKASWRMGKLVVYAVLTLVVLGVLWYLYLVEWNPDRAAPEKKEDKASEQTEGSKP